MMSLPAIGLFAWSLVQDFGEKREEAVLIARGEGSLIHALAHPRERFTPSVGIRLLHTNLDDGAMQVLTTSGSTAIPTRRISYSNVRIMGVAFDEKRLYVALWTASSMDRPLAASQPARHAQWTLEVYDRKSGRRLDTAGLKDEVNEPAPDAETLEKGPISLVRGGVEVFGKTRLFPD